MNIASRASGTARLRRTQVFNAINEFLQKSDRGYFTIVGTPGSGKSAILAKYVTQNPNVIYYNAQIEGKNTAEQFLLNICTQLVETRNCTSCRFANASLHDITLPENATEGSWFYPYYSNKLATNSHQTKT